MISSLMPSTINSGFDQQGFPPADRQTLSKGNGITCSCRTCLSPSPPSAIPTVSEAPVHNADDLLRGFHTAGSSDGEGKKHSIYTCLMCISTTQSHATRAARWTATRRPFFPAGFTLSPPYLLRLTSASNNILLPLFRKKRESLTHEPVTWTHLFVTSTHTKAALNPPHLFTVFSVCAGTLRVLVLTVLVAGPEHGRRRPTWPPGGGRGRAWRIPSSRITHAAAHPEPGGSC